MRIDDDTIEEILLCLHFLRVGINRYKSKKEDAKTLSVLIRATANKLHNIADDVEARYD